MVPVVTLDEVVRTVGRSVRVIKLDLEGAEMEALAGASEVLAERPILFVEAEPEHLARMGSSAEELFDHLQSLSYSIYRRVNGHKLAVQRLHRLVKSAETPNLLAVANERVLATAGIEVVPQ
jgi:hypothetical protein